MNDLSAQDVTVQASPARGTLSSGARESMKWLALLSMTGDHVAKVVFGGYVPVVSEFGRIAFPLFALVMACNLAQPVPIWASRSGACPPGAWLRNPCTFSPSATGCR